MLSIYCNSSVKSLRIGKHVERITKIKPFISKYKWEGINFPPEKDDWKKILKNYLTVALNLFNVKNEKNVSCLYFKK